MKVILIDALDAALSNDATLMTLIGEGTGTGRQTNQTFIGEWKPEVPDKGPFIGIEAFDISPIDSLAPTLPMYRALVSIHCFSTNQLFTSRIADRVQELFVVPQGGENPNVYFFDFSSAYLRAVSATFVHRFQMLPLDTLDSYEDVVQVQLRYSSVPCVEESNPLEFDECPEPADDSPSGNC